MSATNIPYADATWSPVTGCSKVSPGCANCWAAILAHRWGWTKKPWTAQYAAENVVLRPDRLDEPLHWRKPRTVFVCPMSDLFHEQVPDEFIAQVFAVMVKAPTHTFLILTKRPQRMANWLARCGDGGRLGWITHDSTEPARAYQGTGIIVGTTDGWPLPNVWLGVSVENQHWADIRIPLLLDTPGKRWVSIEPMLGPVDLTKIADTDESWIDALGGKRYSTAQHVAIRPKDAPRLSWLVVGGESGPGYRPMELIWAWHLSDRCIAAGVPFYGKQRAAIRPGDPLPGSILGRREMPWTP